MNTFKLRGIIAEKGYSVKRLAEVIGIGPGTLYRRLGKNGQNLTIKEADAIRNALALSRDEARDIFFDQPTETM